MNTDTIINLRAETAHLVAFPSALTFFIVYINPSCYLIVFFFQFFAQPFFLLPLLNFPQPWRTPLQMTPPNTYLRFMLCWICSHLMGLTLSQYKCYLTRSLSHNLWEFIFKQTYQVARVGYKYFFIHHSQMYFFII